MAKKRSRAPQSSRSAPFSNRSGGQEEEEVRQALRKKSRTLSKLAKKVRSSEERSDELRMRDNELLMYIVDTSVRNIVSYHLRPAF